MEGENLGTRLHVRMLGRLACFNGSVASGSPMTNVQSSVSLHSKHCIVELLLRVASFPGLPAEEGESLVHFVTWQVHVHPVNH